MIPCSPAFLICCRVVIPAKNSLNFDHVWCGIVSLARCVLATVHNDLLSPTVAPFLIVDCSACSCQTELVLANSTKKWCTSRAQARRSFLVPAHGELKTSRLNALSSPQRQVNQGKCRSGEAIHWVARWSWAEPSVISFATFVHWMKRPQLTS